MNVKGDIFTNGMGISSSGNLIYGIRSMESFDFLRSKNIQAPHVRAIARARARMSASLNEVLRNTWGLPAGQLGRHFDCTFVHSRQ